MNEYQSLLREYKKVTGGKGFRRNGHEIYGGYTKEEALRKRLEDLERKSKVFKIKGAL